MLEIDPNYELQEEYQNICTEIAPLQMEQESIEEEINEIKNTSNLSLMDVRSSNANSNKHLLELVQNEHKLFIAEVDKKSTLLDMNLMKYQFSNQSQRVADLEKQTVEKQMVLLKKQRELEELKQQMSTWEIDTKTRITQAEIERTRMEQEMKLKQIEFEKRMEKELLRQRFAFTKISDFCIILIF